MILCRSRGPIDLSEGPYSTFGVLNPENGGRKKVDFFFQSAKIGKFCKLLQYLIRGLAGRKSGKSDRWGPSNKYIIRLRRQKSDTFFVPVCGNNSGKIPENSGNLFKKTKLF